MSTVDIVDAVVVVAVDNIEAVADAAVVAAVVAAVDYSVLNLNHAKLVLWAMDVVAKCWAATVIEH